MSSDYARTNHFGFAEYDDMPSMLQDLDSAHLSAVLRQLVQRVLLADPGLIDKLSDAAQSDFIVPLSLAGRMLSSGQYTSIELLSAGCTIRYCADPHLAEFPDDVADLVLQLPS